MCEDTQDGSLVDLIDLYIDYNSTLVYINTLLYSIQAVTINALTYSIYVFAIARYIFRGPYKSFQNVVLLQRRSQCLQFVRLQVSPDEAAHDV